MVLGLVKWRSCRAISLSATSAVMLWTEFLNVIELRPWKY